jgi:hypothetical protein
VGKAGFFSEKTLSQNLIEKSSDLKYFNIIKPISKNKFHIPSILSNPGVEDHGWNSSLVKPNKSKGYLH